MVTAFLTSFGVALALLVPTARSSSVAGFDSAYAGESAYVNVAPGQTANFQAFFLNTGTTTWTHGPNRVALAACLDDGVTCDAQDPREATWNTDPTMLPPNSHGGWWTSTRYAIPIQLNVGPGELGTFSYNIKAPANAAAGTYRFNGDLIVDATGLRIHPEGYFQDAIVAAAT